MKWDGFAFPAPDIRESEHASRVAQSMPDGDYPAPLPETMVNGFIDHLPVAKNPDTSFACFVAGAGGA